ncbi:MAG: ACP S-malonyltransferase [Planctomycetota bacterium]
MKEAILFPGQGSQFVGMGKDLYNNYDYVRKIYSDADKILGFELSKICFEGPEDTLTTTRISQPAILVTSIAALEVFRRTAGRNNSVYATCGLSLGEYTALVFAGSLTFEEALKLVERRGTFMQEACDAKPSGMISVIGLTFDKIEEIVRKTAEKGVVSAANYNSPIQVAVSGDNTALEEATRLAKEAGAKRVLPLKVAGAFHSALMTPAAQKLQPFINEAKFRKPEIKFISNVTGKFALTEEEIRNNLIAQVDHSVLWSQSMELLIAEGVQKFYEVGPGNVLSGLLKRISDSVETESFCSVDSFGG